MAVNPLSALNAYAAAASAAGQDQTAARGASKPGVLGDFAGMIENSIKDAESQMGQAEALSAKAAVGQAELVDVVTAIAAAETSLETMLAVRDEVIRAYQDILKMPI